MLSPCLITALEMISLDLLPFWRLTNLLCFDSIWFISYDLIISCSFYQCRWCSHRVCSKLSHWYLIWANCLNFYIQLVDSPKKWTETWSYGSLCQFEARCLAFLFQCWLRSCGLVSLGSWDSTSSLVRLLDWAISSRHRLLPFLMVVW